MKKPTMNHELRKKIIEQFGSQLSFAFQIGEQDNTVSKVVRGWRKISPEKQKKWAKALGCKPKDVFDG